MKEKRKFDNEEVLLCNLLEILEESKKGGSPYLSLDRFAKIIKVVSKNVCWIDAHSLAKKRGFISQKGNDIKILRKGRVYLRKFYGDASDDDIKLFYDQRPTGYNNSIRIGVIESFIGYLFFSILLFGVLFYLDKLLKTISPERSLYTALYILGLVIVLIFVGCIIYLYFLILYFIVLGVGTTLKKIFSNFGEFLIENSRKTALVLLIATVLVIFVVALVLYGWIALIVAILVSIAVAILFNFKKIWVWIDKKISQLK